MTTLSQHRFAPEALTNIAEHAHASRADVQLDLEEATLSMSDDRRGFDLASLDGDDLSRGRRFRGMRERLEMIGSSLSIGSAPGTGTLPKATVPQIKEAASR
jgi:signal transduction histidine kinase